MQPNEHAAMKATEVPKMIEPFSPDGPQQILTDLCRLAAQRLPTEEAIAAGLRSRNEAAETEYQDGIQSLTTRYRAGKGRCGSRTGGYPAGGHEPF